MVLGDLGGAQKPGIGPWLILAVLNKLRMHRKNLLPSQSRTHSPFPVRNAFSASPDLHSALHSQWTARLALVCAQFGTSSISKFTEPEGQILGLKSLDDCSPGTAK